MNILPVNSNLNCSFGTVNLSKSKKVIADKIIREYSKNGNIDTRNALVEVYRTAIEKHAKNRLIGKALIDDYEQDLTDSEKRQKLREDAVERLEQGQPILYSGDLVNNNGGHIGVAYAYDEENDNIIGHIGWKGGARSKTNFDVAFSRFNEFSYLVISDDLRVSENNYRYKIGDMLFESFDLPSHVHAFDKAIHYGYALKHALQCTCGEVQYEFHSLVGRCKCGYKRF